MTRKNPFVLHLHYVGHSHDYIEKEVIVLRRVTNTSVAQYILHSFDSKIITDYFCPLLFYLTPSFHYFLTIQHRLYTRETSEFIESSFEFASVFTV